ncbi:hypothetical protein RRG08_030459 [Elysia crispata]|uniref:Uncharacterized protein n=1 Tax=Elysia crispata TaxID=231223 RepID=A0AAE1E8X4_9GAST|nr:hypothetical protein RRG08_030459 [Elysia crispata]
MDRLVYLGAISFLMILQASGSEALESDIVGITVAACVSFFLLCVVITMVVVSFTWTSWYNSWMRGKGKVRMPKAYFEKKEEARRRLLAESASQSVRSAHSVPRSRPSSANLNGGQPPHQSIDRALYVRPSTVLKYPSMSKTSWVQGWNQNSGPREHETLGATMVLGDEQDEEFKIETILVDNEVLDVGPYSESHPDEKPVKGDVYPVPYIYSSGDKTNSSAATTSGQMTTETTPTSSAPREATSTGEMVEVTDGYVYATVGENQNLDDMVVRL